VRPEAGTWCAKTCSASSSAQEHSKSSLQLAWLSLMSAPRRAVAPRAAGSSAPRPGCAADSPPLRKVAAYSPLLRKVAAYSSHTPANASTRAASESTCLPPQRARHADPAPLCPSPHGVATPKNARLGDGRRRRKAHGPARGGGGTACAAAGCTAPRRRPPLPPLPRPGRGTPPPWRGALWAQHQLPRRPAAPSR